LRNRGQWPGGQKAGKPESRKEQSKNKNKGQRKKFKVEEHWPRARKLGSQEA